MLGYPFHLPLCKKVSTRGTHLRKACLVTQMKETANAVFAGVEAKELNESKTVDPLVS